LRGKIWSMKLKTKFRVLEFIVFGVISNLADNLLTLYYFGNQPVGLRVAMAALIFVIPFSIMEEIIVDHPAFWLKLCRACGINTDRLAKIV
jgi:uncharacterized membrane protein